MLMMTSAKLGQSKTRNSAKPWKLWLVGIVIVVLIGAFWLWSGGVYFFRHQRFERSTNRNGLLQLRIASTSDRGDNLNGISWLVEGEPYYLVVGGDFSHDSPYSSIRVNSLEAIIHEDRSVPLQFTEGLEAELFPMETTWGTADGLVTHNFRRLYCKLPRPLPDSVASFKTFVIRLEAELVEENGRVKEITVDQAFEKEERLGLVPFVWVLNQR